MRGTPIQTKGCREDVAERGEASTIWRASEVATIQGIIVDVTLLRPSCLLHPRASGVPSTQSISGTESAPALWHVCEASPACRALVLVTECLRMLAGEPTRIRLPTNVPYPCLGRDSRVA